MIHRLILPALQLGYILWKYRKIAGTVREPGHGEVLFPRQDARAAHHTMTILESVFVLEFISHAARDEAAWIRLLVTLLIFILIDGIYWLKLQNTAISYDHEGITATNLIGRQRNILWEEVRAVHTSGTGVKSARYFTLKTAKGNLRINARSGGLERFRNFMENRL